MALISIYCIKFLMGASESKTMPAADAITDAIAGKNSSSSVPAPRHDQAIDAQLAALEAELQASQGFLSTVQQQKLQMLEADLRLQQQLADLDDADGDEGTCLEEGSVRGLQGDQVEEEVLIEEHELAELEAELEALEMQEAKQDAPGEEAAQEASSPPTKKLS